MGEGSRAVAKVRAMIESGEAVTFSAVRWAHPELLAGEISSSLCYLIRKGEAVREMVTNTSGRKQTRKHVWQYRRAKNEG